MVHFVLCKFKIVKEQLLLSIFLNKKYFQNLDNVLLLAGYAIFCVVGGLNLVPLLS